MYVCVHHNLNQVKVSEILTVCKQSIFLPEPEQEGSTKMYSTFLYLLSCGSTLRKSQHVGVTQDAPAVATILFNVFNRSGDLSNAKIFLENNHFVLKMPQILNAKSILFS